MKQLVAFSIWLSLAYPIIGQEDLNKYFFSKGLVDVTGIDASLKVELRYAGIDNFLGEAVYRQISGAWLHPEAAAKLVKAQALLKVRRPEYSLLIYDAARPMSVQRAMWNLARKAGKAKYVSNPANGGGLHNYGMAVDLTIVDASGRPLDMGSRFDHFGSESHINDEENLLRSRKISSEAYANRRLLRTIMRQAGFRTILYEWWHFNACSREEAKARLPLL
ncbi:MAG: M15 family metallopeptidase [Tannerellaceae bacterium]|jgi:D-alanyl-D-alanine dipeptidase|nr:M15 family metallopeptidase [Tannerellaceae bacterium]